MRFFGSNQDDRRTIAGRSQPSARARLLSDRGSSPRAAVALSALSTVTWLKRTACHLIGRITVKRIATGRQKLVAETQNVTLGQGN